MIPKYRYYFQSKDGTIYNQVFTLGQIERGMVQYFQDAHMPPLPEIIARCQFTGLTDKNGVEVYGKDIVNWDEQNLEAIFCNGSFSIQPWKDEGCHCLAHCVKEDLEVLGNTIENPELLQGGEA